MFSRSSNDAGGRAVLSASHPRVTIHSRHRDISCVARHQRDADTPHLARGFSKKLLLFYFFFASFLRCVLHQFRGDSFCPCYSFQGDGRPRFEDPSQRMTQVRVVIPP